MVLTPANMLVILVTAAGALAGCVRYSRDTGSTTISEQGNARSACGPVLTVYVPDPLHGPLSDLLSAGLRAHPTPVLDVVLESYGPRGGIHWTSWVRSIETGSSVPAKYLVIVSTDGFSGPDNFPGFIAGKDLTLTTGTFVLRGRACTYYFVSRLGSGGNALDMWKRWLE